jgi:hypothetical protein
MVRPFKIASQAATYLISPYPCCLRKLQGYCGGVANTQYFIYIFDDITAGVNNPTPLRVLQVVGGDGFSFSFEDTELQALTYGLFVALSTTENTYTAVGGGVTADWEGEVDQAQIQSLGSMTIVGDLTTSVGNLQVWSEASGTTTPKRLMRLELLGGTGYPLVTFTDTFDLSDTTAVHLPQLNGNFITYSFGRGMDRFKNDAGTIRRGCTIRFSSVGAPPFVEVGGTNFSVKAYYI